MNIEIHPHALQRMEERGATKEEVRQTVLSGEQTPARYGRTRFRRNLMYRRVWRGKHYETKQLEVFATPTTDGWLVITVITRFF